MWPAALLELLKAIWPSIVGAVKLLAAAKVGQSVASGEAAARELEKVHDAARASARVDLLSDDDVVRELKKRGLYRDGEASAGSKRQ